MIEEVYKDVKERMTKIVDILKSELTKIRTGKATTALLDGIKVEYYGGLVPLKQVANIGTPDLHLIIIQPWEKNMIKEIEKAILKSELGLVPINDGNSIRVPIPKLTEERRHELVKLVKKFGEDSKVSIRNVRRDGNEKVKKMEKNKEITEDQMREGLDKIQEITDEYIEKIEKVVEVKDKEIMEI
jgi:ribosome recycling factor